MEVSFSIRRENGVLRGIAHLPEAENCPCLVLCHGLTGDAHERPLIRIARALEKAKIACIRYDCMGSGDSDGESAQASVTTEVEDTLAVIDYARGLPQVDPDRIAVGGHSLGGLVAILAAQSGKVGSMVLLSPALSCYHELIALLTGETLKSFRETGALDLGGFKVSKAMVDELSDIDGYRIACELNLPTLLIHGELDGESPVYHSVRLKEKLGQRAELHIVANAHHCYETSAAQAEVARRVTEFLQKMQ